MGLPVTAQNNGVVPSVNIPRDKRDKIIEMLVSGEYPIDAAIARAVDVPVKVVHDLLESDPELKEMREQAQEEMAQRIEAAAVDLALNGRNEIAKQKQQEFLLRKLRPAKFGDHADKLSGMKMPRRVVLMPALPVVAVDADGIPLDMKEQEPAIDAEVVERQ